MVSEEQSYSKQPMLVAHPSHIKQLITASQAEGDQSEYVLQKASGYSMEQISPELFESFLSESFAVKSSFLECPLETLKAVESRVGILLPPDQRPRNDKHFDFNITQIEGIEEYKELHAVARLLYCIPFEMNMRASWLQLQLSEHFEVSYYQEGLWHRKHIDSGFSKTEADFDTGVKVTFLYAIGKGEATVQIWVEGELKKEVAMTSNTLIIMKSRRVEYEITGKLGKLFIVYGKISGPVDTSKLI